MTADGAALDGVRHYLFDLDGCVWNGGTPAPGAAALIVALRSTGLGVFFLTNVSGSTAPALAARLSRAGIVTEPAAVMAPLSVLPRHPLLRDRPAALVIGTAVVHAVLREHGVRVVENPEDAGIVVVGRDPRMTYGDLAAAVRALDRGAPLLALNLDRRVPSGGGVFVPGVGAIVAALTAATGVQPEVVGKPSAFYFQEALRHFGIAAGGTAMVGDSFDSDVAGGARAGLRTVLVGPGLGDEDAGVCPDVRVGDLDELRRLLVSG